jgi:hypothetical protein
MEPVVIHRLNPALLFYRRRVATRRPARQLVFHNLCGDFCSRSGKKLVAGAVFGEEGSLVATAWTIVRPEALYAVGA